MGHHHDGAPVGQFADDLGDRRLVLPVQGGGDLIEQEDRGVLDEGAGDRDALALTAGQAQATGSHLRIPSVRERFDDPVQAGAAGRLLQLGFGGLGSGDAQILPDGRVEEIDVLEDHGGHSHDLGGGQGAHIGAAYGDRPGADIPEAGRQTQNR